ncbi:MAG TPA: HesA/MoeB/ThiF family protein [Clostridiaceae bacterium]|nr:HesA/MoeB/ThiF family protein [Clostridiaceae bacterium]
MIGESDLLRYSRQILLKDVGHKGQEKLLNSRVLVIGTGGLGSPASYYLAAAGVGTLGIVDFDTVNMSNLHRQILHFTDDLERNKVDSAEEKLKKLNPGINIIKYPVKLNADNIEDIIRQYDVVIDAVDNYPTRYLISDSCYRLNKPLVEGAVLGFEGILMTIIPNESPCYRCLYPVPPEAGKVPTCNDVGIIGMVAGTIGSLQALEAVKVILGIGRTLSGRILTFDGLNLDFRTIDWKRKSNCPLCGENAVKK